MNSNTPEKQQEDLFKIVLDTVSDGVTVIDKDLKIQYQNKTIVQLFGSKIGEHCYEAYRSRKEPCGDCMVLEVLKDGRERRGIRDIPLPDGGISLVEISSAAIKDAEGKIIGAVEVARDVTDQKSDGSIWGFNEFLEFMAQPSNADQSTLDSLLNYARQLSQKETFEDYFSILEIVLH